MAVPLRAFEVWWGCWLKCRTALRLWRSKFWSVLWFPVGFLEPLVAVWGLDYIARWRYRRIDVSTLPLGGLVGISGILLPGDFPPLWLVPRLTRGDGSWWLERPGSPIRWLPLPLTHMAASPCCLGGAALALWSPAALSKVLENVLVNKRLAGNHLGVWASVEPGRAAPAIGWLWQPVRARRILRTFGWWRGQSIGRAALQRKDQQLIRMLLHPHHQPSIFQSLTCFLAGWGPGVRRPFKQAMGWPVIGKVNVLMIFFTISCKNQDKEAVKTNIGRNSLNLPSDQSPKELQLDQLLFKIKCLGWL